MSVAAKFGIGRRTSVPLPTGRRPLSTVQATEWSRTAMHTVGDTRGNTFRFRSPIIRIRSFGEDAGEIRVGVWSGNTILAGWYVPTLPARSLLVIDGASRRVAALHDGETLMSPILARSWDGTPVKWVNLPNGLYDLTVDQAADARVRLQVSFSTVPTAAR